MSLTVTTTAPQLPVPERLRIPSLFVRDKRPGEQFVLGDGTLLSRSSFPVLLPAAPLRVPVRRPTLVPGT